MTYGNDAADQIVRFSLDGTEMVLKLSGLAAKNFALFVYTVLNDQQKVRGKTKLVRMLKERRPFKFFRIPEPKTMACSIRPFATSPDRGRSSWWCLPMMHLRSIASWTT